MKRITTATMMALGLGLGFSGMALANPITAQLNSVRAGITGNFINYQESVPARFGPADTETGFMPGFALRASGTPDLFGLPVYAAFKFNQYGGDLNYHWGRLQSLDSAHFYTVGGDLGVPFTFGRTAAVLPYISGGYHHWNRNLQGPGGYNEVYSNEYAGLGVKGYYALSRQLVLGATVNVRAILGGGVTAMGYGYRGLATSLYAPFGTSAEESVGASVNYRINPLLGLYGDVGYSHMNYTGGPVSGMPAFEPRSVTNQVSVGAGVRVYF